MRMCTAASDSGAVCTGMLTAEPLDNLDAVMAAVDIMTHPLGLHMSRQKVCHIRLESHKGTAPWQTAGVVGLRQCWLAVPASSNGARSKGWCRIGYKVQAVLP